MDYKAAREAAGLTLEKASELAEFAISTINALELKGRGSARLKKKLSEIYGVCKYPDLQSRAAVLHDAPQKNVIAKLRQQVQNMESSLREIKSALDELKP